MNIANLHRVHCLGLGGVGVSAVAKILAGRGVKVSGSELHPSRFTMDAAQAGITVYPKESAANITDDIELIIYSDACPPSHPERIAANKKKIPERNFSEVLGTLMGESEQSVAVAGTNGKSTTTALVGLMLTAAKNDPTVMVGSRVPAWSGNVRMGGSKYFVAEADDYRDHFLHLKPTLLVVTNIELDHVDYFSNLAAVKKSFTRLAGQTSPAGNLIVNQDDPASVEVMAGDPRAVTYSQTGPADLQAVSVRQAEGYQAIDVAWRGQAIGRWNLHLPGSFNVMNALAAGAAALTLGVTPEVVAATVEAFRGIWRRFEVLNPGGRVTIVNDYAHHPTAISGTLDGAKALWPNRRVLAVFQPHHHNRLTNLFEAFVRSFGLADQTIISEVYAVAGREDHDPNEKTSRDLVAAINNPRVVYGGTPAETEILIKKLAKPGDLVILMSAGDLWEIGPRLADYYE